MLQSTNRSSEPMTSSAPTHVHAGIATDHVVQFYENDTFLVDVVAEFYAEGLSTGQAAVLIATPDHTAAFIAKLKAGGFELDHALRNGLFTVLDAREMLRSFMVGGMPDRDLFCANVGRVIEKSLRRSGQPSIRAYGEMVDVLWKDGNPDGAIRLEALWNELAGTYAFSLLCAYAMDNFHQGAHTVQFEEVCRQHGHVLPTEAYTRVDGDAGRLREITLLQQRAVALQHELAHRQDLEQALREALAREQLARTEAEHANRVKDDFLAVLSHELRTPLNAILGWTQIARARASDPTTIIHGLDVIARNAELQMRLIDDLLDISRIERGKMQLESEPVDLVLTVTAAAETLRPAAAVKEISVHVSVKAPSAFVSGDAGRLHQIVWNLLSNSIKFTPAGGRLDLELEVLGAKARIIVRDNGQGIPVDFLPRVFDRFCQADTTTTRPYGGLGLGLSVVRNLVEAHGGTVTAESDGVDAGATFTVLFPLRA
jgi:signal transduction histidine kinase